jgi:hypothetical protein
LIVRLRVVSAIAVYLSGTAIAEGDMNICDREISSYYVPIETRRGFNAIQSRGFHYRLRLVVELMPESTIVDIDGTAPSTQPKESVKELRSLLNHCLSREPSKSLLEKAVEAHGPDKEPSAVLTKAFNKSLHQCFEEKVPESFRLAVDLFCDWKLKDWH